ncbi:histidine kinase [Lentzea sp. NPDC051838]|uniref:sensor histidine kinase n=1 Tax=Lentzea sp. NPDC051838 TaxID=3154849 RepID=UPI003439394F
MGQRRAWTQVDLLLVASAVACVEVFVFTGLVNGFDRAFRLGGGIGVTPPALLQTHLVRVIEGLALMLLAVLVTRKIPRLRAAAAVTALTLVSVHAAILRPGFYLERRDAVLFVSLLAVIAVGIGVVLRMRDASKAALAAAAEDRARRDERLDMARELHDVVAHHVTGMLVQAQAALVVGEQDRARAYEMLPGIVDGGTDALGAMRAMVRTLRDNGTSTATSDLTADLQQLVERSGLPVRSSIELTTDVRPELGRSVLRLVQEALTNTRKHAANATSVEVEVRLTASAVLLSVVDNGTARPAHSGGFGLVGMQERVHELGGRFFAGATGDGWLVTAELPLEVRA